MPCPPIPAVEGNAELGEPVLHEAAVALSWNDEFRIRVQVPPPRGQFLVQLGCQGADLWACPLSA